MNFIHSLDAWLWNRNIRHADVRAVLRVQILIALGSMMLGVAVWMLTHWILWFGISFFVATINFYALARFLSGTLTSQYTSAMLVSMIISSNVRLLLLAVFLYVALVWLAAPLSALLVGLIGGTVILTGVSLARHFSRSEKEA